MQIVSRGVSYLFKVDAADDRVLFVFNIRLIESYSGPTNRHATYTGTHMRTLATVSTVLIITVLISGPALAYVGPGVGLGVIGAIFASIAAFFMMLAGLVWYPVKVALRKRREKNAAAQAAATEGASVEATAAQPTDTPSAE